MYTDTQSENGVEIILRLGTVDLYDIQRKRYLAISADSTHLTIETGAVWDMNDLRVENVTLDLEMINFILDDTPPLITGFELDVDEGTMSLTFDDHTTEVHTNTPQK